MEASSLVLHCLCSGRGVRRKAGCSSVQIASNDTHGLPCLLVVIVFFATIVEFDRLFTKVYLWLVAFSVRFCMMVPLRMIGLSLPMLVALSLFLLQSRRNPKP